MDPVLKKALWETAWGSKSRRTATSLLAFLAAVGSAITAVPPAWTAMGLPEVASKHFVHVVVDPVKIAQTETTRAVNQLIITQLQAQLYQAKQDLKATPSPTVQLRVDELKEQLERLQAKGNSGP